MAFKERYERELAEARLVGRRLQWSMSAGYDIGHRLTTLANAVQEKRMSLDAALDLVPGEQLNDFAQMLPPGKAKALLTGNARKGSDLPGLAGILAKMRMEGMLPEELRADPRPPHMTPSDRSPEEA